MFTERRYLFSFAAVRTLSRTDLSQIHDNLDELDPKPFYDSKERFRLDLDLMIRNCKTYNAVDTDYWIAAHKLEAKINELLPPTHMAEQGN